MRNQHFLSYCRVGIAATHFIRDITYMFSLHKYYNKKKLIEQLVVHFFADIIYPFYIVLFKRIKNISVYVQTSGRLLWKGIRWMVWSDLSLLSGPGLVSRPSMMRMCVSRLKCVSLSSPCTFVRLAG